MRVSVLMPVRNAGTMIRGSLVSILANSQVGEVIIVDDGSTDDTCEEVARIADERLRLLHAPPRQTVGIAGPLNIGLAAVRFPLMARCDADDFYPPDRFAWQSKLMDDPTLVGVSGGFETVDDRGRRVATLATEGAGRDVTLDLRDGRPCTHLCTWLMRTEIVQSIGGFREWFETSQDIDLQCRMAFAGRVWHEPRVAYIYRLHDDSITHRAQPRRRDFFDRCGREFARERSVRGSDALEDGRPPQPPIDNSSERDRAIDQQLGQMHGQAWRLHRAGRRWKATRMIVRALRADPFRLGLWRSFLLIALRPSGRRDG